VSNKFYGNLREQREQWKRETLLGGRAPEDLDYRKFRERRGRPERYETPELPLNKRFEGMWIVGSQGSGKTQFFKRQIRLDLDMVAAGRASLFILDPTGDQAEARDPDTGEFAESATLVHTITRLRRFAKGGDLHRKLVYINPEDHDYYVPINLFAIHADPDDEDAVDSVIESYVSIINGLLGQTLTQFQDTVIRHAIIATMAFPNPDLSKLREVLTVHPPATTKYTPPTPIYQEILHKLHPDVQSYFHSTYENQRETRNAVLARLASLTTSGKFRRIFTGARMALNFPELINEPRVVVVNASREYLGALKELYGRFFLSLLKRAGEARPSGSIPCFAYIDECDEFCKTDQYAGEIIFKLRRKRVALTLGNQATNQVEHPVARRAFFSTAIKLINLDEPDSAKEIAEALNLRSEGGKYDIDHFLGRPAFDFAYYVRGMTKEPIPYRFKPGVLEADPAMNEEQWQEVYAEIRDRYYEPINRQGSTTPAQAEIAATPRRPITPRPAPTPDPPIVEGSEGATVWDNDMT